MPSTPAIVLVAGGFHNVSLYSPTTELLRQANYQVFPVTLPGVGANPPLENADSEIAAVRDALLQAIDVRGDVVLVLHSWSGAIGSDAVAGLSRKEREAEGKSGGVVHLVYVSAVVAEAGTGNKEPFPWMRVEPDSRAYPIDPINLFYNDLPASQAEHLASQLQHDCWGCFKHVVTHTPWREIPCTYVICERDNCLPAPIQEALASQPGNLFRIERIDAGHSPFVSKPRETAGAIRKAAGEEV